MDTLTHALSGALAARAAAPRDPSRLALTRSQWLAAGFCAAAFPDVDYLYYLVDRLEYLNVHQGLTHSLVLWPAWAAALGLVFAILLGGMRAWAPFSAVCALGIAMHIAGDLLTTFGVQALAPLSGERLSLRATFVIDPWLSALLIAGLAVGGARRARAAAVSALAAVALYVTGQLLLQRQALDVARAYAAAEGLAEFRTHALPQPFHPFNWKLVVEDPAHYHEAYLNLAAARPSAFIFPAHWIFGRMAAAYRPAADLHWRRHPRLGAAVAAPGIQAAWHAPALAGFRRFAGFPVLHRVDRTRDARCLWFTDLRYTYPELKPPFRYGVCRTQSEREWRAYRLRFFTDNERQPL